MKNIPIVIDPRYGAGKPTIPKTRVTIETIHKRWKAGQNIRFLATDFWLKSDLIETSLRFAESYAT